MSLIFWVTFLFMFIAVISKHTIRSLTTDNTNVNILIYQGFGGFINV